jgi:putative hydrolase of the HAD superfamily
LGNLSLSFTNPRPVIKALIFDLDNCLSAAVEVGAQLFEPAFDLIRRANRGTLTDAELKEAFSDCWRHPLDFVAAKHRFSKQMLDAGWEVFARMEVEVPMHGYPDLDVLAELPVQRFLVTSGFRRLQEGKVKALGIEHLFTEIHIDAIDEPDRQGKLRIFETILDRHELRPEEVLVVGDNADSEIEAGNRLWIKTVQVLRPGVARASNAAHHIQTLTELKELARLDHGTSFLESAR